MRLKTFFIISIGCIILAFGYGLYCKSQFLNIGIADIRGISDLQNLDGKIQEMITADFMTSMQTNMDYRVYENAPFILTVKPTGKVRQFNQTNIQEVVVVQSQKGDIAAGTVINVTHFGGMIHYNFGEYQDVQTPLFPDLVNLMQPDQEYLIFAEANVLGEYFVERYYDLVGSYGLYYVNLSIEDNSVIAQQKEYQLSDFADHEFIVDSQEYLNILNEIKKKIITIAMKQK
jgi:hypothetical protein